MRVGDCVCDIVCLSVIVYGVCDGALWCDESLSACVVYVYCVCVPAWFRVIVCCVWLGVVVVGCVWLCVNVCGCVW